MALEAKADRYVTQLLALDRVLQQWRHKKLDNQEAQFHHAQPFVQLLVSCICQTKQVSSSLSDRPG